MSGFITFAIVIALIVWGEVKKNKRREEAYRKQHPYANAPSTNTASANATYGKATPNMRRQAQAVKSRMKSTYNQAQTAYNKTATTRTASKQAASSHSWTAAGSANGNTTADDNSVYQQMRQTTADTAAKKVADAKDYADNRVQREEDAYRAEARSISTKIDSSELINEVYEILACGYHPETEIIQRDFVGEGLDMLKQYT